MTMSDAATSPLSFDTALPAAADFRGEAWAGVALAGAFFVGVVGWASIAPLDGAVYAPGVVVVSGHRLVVQSADTGAVKRIDVKEGDQVAAGQVLVEFADETAGVEAAALNTRTLSLKAHLSRLRAEQTGQSQVAEPADFALLPAEQHGEAQQILALEQAQLSTQRQAERARDAVLRTRAAEVGQQVEGYRRELEANHLQQEINTKELEGVRSLAARGYASQTRVNTLERAAAGLQGDSGAHEAEIGRLRTTAGETQLQMAQYRSERAQQVVEDIRKTQDELQQLEPQRRLALQQLEHTVVRAPAAGAVVNLKTNTVGGVVGHGEALMEIVPKAAEMVLEGRVAPKNIDELKVGQETQVRFPGLHGRDVPILHGTVRRIGADAIADPRTGVSTYSIDVSVSPEEMARAPAQDGQAVQLKPGMPAQILVPLQKRTALQFWVGPLMQTFWRSLREP